MNKKKSLSITSTSVYKGLLDIERLDKDWPGVFDKMCEYARKHDYYTFSDHTFFITQRSKGNKKINGILFLMYGNEFFLFKNVRLYSNKNAV